MHCITDSGSLDTLSQTRSSLLISEWHLLENVLHADPTPSFFSFHILIYFIFNLCGCIFVGYATNWKFQFSSVVQSSRSVMSDSLWPHETQHTRPHCPSPTPGVHPNSLSVNSVMPSNHLILCRPLLLMPSIFPSIRVFSNESALHIRWPKYWISASASVLPMNIQDWSPLGWTGWISLQSKGLSRVFSSTTVWKHQFFNTQLSLSGSYFGSITECLQEGQVLELVTGSEVLSQCSHLFTRKMLLLSSVCC